MYSEASIENESRNLKLAIINLDEDPAQAHKKQGADNNKDLIAQNCRKVFRIQRGSFLDKVIVKYEESDDYYDKEKWVSKLSLARVEGTFYAVVVSRLSLTKTTTEHASDQKNKPEKSQLLDKDKDADQTSHFDAKPGKYKSIYFFNLSTQKVEWEILGAQQLIEVTNDQEVLYRSHSGSIDTVIWKTPHNTSEGREQNPPSMQTVKQYTGLINYPGTIHLHGDRVTFINKWGYEAITYILDQSKALEEAKEVRAGEDKAVVMEAKLVAYFDCNGRYNDDTKIDGTPWHECKSDFLKDDYKT